MKTNVQVQPMEVRDGVEVINICTLMDAMGVDWCSHDSYTAITELVPAWCVANGASHYSASREDFWVGYGVALAKAEGKSRVVVEDLS